MKRRTFLGSLAAGALLPACGAGGHPARESTVDAPSSGGDPYTEPHVKPLLDAALQAARDAGATYADVRISTHRTQSLASREERIRSVSDTESHGVGVRVVADGAWGFAAAAAVTEGSVVDVARRAVAVARGNAALRAEPVVLAPVAAHVGRWQTPIRRDPFAVTLEEKVEKLLGINRLALATPGVSFCSSSMAFAREHKRFASTEGTYLEQVLHRCNPTFAVTSVDARRGSFRTREALCAPQGRGYEFVEDYDWEADVRQAAAEAVAMHSARPVEPGPTDLVLLPSNLWLTIHESIGHPTELDRAVGLEANFAGTSFLTPDTLGKLKIGSDLVDLVAEKTAEGALATCAWDDDGVPTTAWPLVEKGVFVDYQVSRDQAHWLGRGRFYGSSYAQSWRDVAFQRMPNVNLRPGPDPLTLEELVAGVDRGILVSGRGSYSIDHQRYNFQFGGQVFREIRNGVIGDLLTDVAYQSRTPDFWSACDAICDARAYEVNGSFHDGKGEPGQSNAVSHGCAPARFRNINVLNTGRA